MNQRLPLAMSAIFGGGAFLASGSAIAQPPLTIARVTLLGCALAAAAVYDLRERRIPNRLVVPVSAACLALALAQGALSSALAGGLAIVAALAVLSLARPRAIGMGDVKLALLVTLGLLAAATPALLLALASAAAAGLLLVCLRGRRALNTALPLAPFVYLGAQLALVT